MDAQLKPPPVGARPLDETLSALWRESDPLPARALLHELAGVFLHAWQADSLAKTLRLAYNPKMRTTLGRAILNDQRIELNPRLLLDHPGQLLGTLGHELAHLVIWDRFGKNAQPHGREFRTLMRQVHLAEKATHNLPVEHLRRKRKAYLYLHRCSLCSYQFAARKARRNTYCRQCGPEMTWDIFRLPNTPAGQRMMKRMLEG